MRSPTTGPWRLAGWSAGAALLLLPLVAMRFTDEVQWDLADFAFAGALVVGVGVSWELAVRKSAKPAWRAGVAIALMNAFVLAWSNAAVGIIGSEDNPANAMFHGVLAVGIAGALIARLRPQGMAWALVATAVAQVAVAAVAAVAGMGPAGPALLFAAPWLASAWMFRKAARSPVIPAKAGNQCFPSPSPAAPASSAPARAAPPSDGRS